MEYSKKFVEKLVGIILKPITDEHFLRTVIRWMVDSQYRRTVQVDKFLKDQIDNPDTDVLKVAKSLRKPTQDDTIINVLKYVTGKVKYKSDKENFGKVEYWATAKETLTKGYDDCDGINGAIYVLARLAGISRIKLWSILGNTSAGYHYWLVYFSTERDLLFSIDGTFYPTLTPIKTRQPFILNINRYIQIDYLFNEDDMFIG